ncbi:MAG TPA: STAS domain-containing protein [Clostridiales bacterium]|jgi:stage II sporulation protein AA (anti-sigma F factor antagonist)|nr:anti-sigma factor antagonist [Clostridium sp.]CDE55282.1 anti-sigma F factor antagonist [Clostridium sp. CAG:269]HCQ55442.1 STAS domain-containing protein [Clostridiales bacterium]
MKITYIKKDKRLIFEIEEDIDECCVQKIRRRIDNEIQRYMPKEVIFDFSNVSFMDSAGIGLIIGRYKLINMIGGELKIANVNTQIQKIFEMSGLLRLIPVEQKNKKEVQYD